MIEIETCLSGFQWVRMPYDLVRLGQQLSPFYIPWPWISCPIVWQTIHHHSDHSFVWRSCLSALTFQMINPTHVDGFRRNPDYRLVLIKTEVNFDRHSYWSWIDASKVTGSAITQVILVWDAKILNMLSRHRGLGPESANDHTLKKHLKW